MIDEWQYYVYILASRIGGTLCVGVTNDLFRRMAEHKEGRGSRFVAEYRVARLVYFEVHDSAYAAIEREKRIKRWRRAWKIRLIEEHNPNWDDRFKALRP